MTEGVSLCAHLDVDRQIEELDLQIQNRLREDFPDKSQEPSANVDACVDLAL